MFNKSKTILKESEYNKPFETKADLHSKTYMLVFYAVSLLVLFSMCLQFSGIESLKASVEISNDDGFMFSKQVNTEDILSINEHIPYDILIYALIFYCLSMFGIEGTRAIVASMEIKDISEKAKNMPRYKQNRLLQMLIIFIILSIIGVAFTSIGNVSKADYHLVPLFSGIGIFMSLLAYANIGPKLSNEIKKKNIMDNERKEECDNIVKEKDEEKKE